MLHQRNLLYKRKLYIISVKIFFFNAIVFLVFYLLKIKIYYFILISIFCFFVLFLKFLSLYNKTPIYAFSEPLHIEYSTYDCNIPIAYAYEIT